ncbi:hypothetical protein ACLB2K_010316 [Fragaria x ananassa]
MAVATIGADSLGPVFQELCDQVSRSMEKNSKFKTLLGYLQCTLNSVKELIIQPMQENLQLQEETMREERTDERLMVIVQEGQKLITDKFSKLRRWDLYFCMDDHTLRLLELDSFLRYLLEALWVRELDDVNDIKGYMQNSMSVGVVYNFLNENLQRIVDTFEKALEPETMAPEERNHEEEEGMEQPALLVFESLSFKVHEVLNKKKTPVMFKLLLNDIFDTLSLLKPFMEDKAAAFDGQDEELRIFKAKMVKGVEFVRKSSEFGVWGGYSKRKTKPSSADGKECDEEGVTDKRKALAFRRMEETVEMASDEFKCITGAEQNQTRFAGLM